MDIKHKEVIQAWLDGEIIQYKLVSGHWQGIASPSFKTSNEYRVKPPYINDEWYKVTNTCNTYVMMYLDGVFTTHNNSLVTWVADDFHAIEHMVSA